MDKTEFSPSYWAVVPAPIRYDDQIPASAKLLYAEISSLTYQEGYCWADNAYFAGLYQITERTVRRLLDALAGRGYIRIEEERGNHGKLESRRIYAGLNPLAGAEPLNKNVRPLDKNVQRHFIKKQEILTLPPISPAAQKEFARMPREAADKLLEVCGEDAALLDAWLGFAETRRAKRSPIKTARTVELLGKKLDKLAGADAASRIAILEQSTERGWTGLFALKHQDTADSAGGYWSTEESY